MSWMDAYYQSLAKHNMKECVPSECRHCKREKEVEIRTNTAIQDAKILYGELKDTIIASVHASFNGGSDESFVDYVHYYDKAKFEIHHDELWHLDEQSEPWKSWSKQMEKIAWGILGHGFGNGDFSVSGTIVLDIVQGKLMRCREEIATLREAA